MNTSIMTRLTLLLGLVALIPVAAAADDDSGKPDARVAAAMAQGQAGLPAFDAALAKDRRAMLDVKVPYGRGQTETLWLGAVRHNADGTYDGIVLDRVSHVPDLIPGSLYHARRDQVADWIYEDEAGDHGGFTVKIMRQSKPGHVDGFHFAD